MENEKPTLEYAPPPRGLRRLWELGVRVLKSRAMKWGAVVLLCLGFIGFISDSVSEQACESAAARKLYADMGPRPFYSPASRGAYSRGIFTSIGVVPLPDPAAGTYYHPWLSSGRAHWAAPFVIDVDYGWMYEATYGEGGVRRYFCFFGWVIEWGHYPSWMS